MIPADRDFWKLSKAHKMCIRDRHQKEKPEDVKEADMEGQNIEERQSIGQENKLRLTAFVSDYAPVSYTHLDVYKRQIL